MIMQLRCVASELSPNKGKCEKNFDVISVIQSQFFVHKLNRANKIIASFFSD